MTDGGSRQLVVNALSLTRGTKTLFSDLTWQIESGNAMVLRGPNGSGKTSLLRALAGLTAVDTGTIQYCGERWSPLVKNQRQHCLYLGHANALKDELTAMENLTEALAFDGSQPKSDLLAVALDRVGLTGRHHLQARRLSQGQKRRVGLARLSLSGKSVWLLDEPTNALDSEGVDLFTGILDTHLKQGGLACIATHLPMTMSSPIHELMLGERRT